MVTKKSRWCDASGRFTSRHRLGACVLGLSIGLFVSSCNEPPSSGPTPSQTGTEAASQQDSTQPAASEVPTITPTEADAPTTTAAAARFSEAITAIRDAVGATMSDTWTTQVVDDSRPEEVCEGRAHVNVVVPAQASGAVRSIAQDAGAAVSIVARRYTSPESAAEALDYVAVTSTTDCNPLEVTEGFEDFFVAESVDQAQLSTVDDAQGWASYRRSIANPDDVQVAAYSASYRVGESLATITGRVEVGAGEDPDDAVARARQLQSTVVAPIVDVLQNAP